MNQKQYLHEVGQNLADLFYNQNKMKQKTAVEWLVEELTKQNMFMHLFAKEIEQAKAIEKERIIKHSVELCKILMSNPFETSGKRPQELIDSYFSKTFKSE